jgi:hypothetical protein
VHPSSSSDVGIRGWLCLSAPLRNRCGLSGRRSRPSGACCGFPRRPSRRPRSAEDRGPYRHVPPNIRHDERVRVVERPPDRLQLLRLLVDPDHLRGAAAAVEHPVPQLRDLAAAGLGRVRDEVRRPPVGAERRRLSARDRLVVDKRFSTCSRRCRARRSGRERRRAESNRCTRLCRPLPNHSATAPAATIVAGWFRGLDPG